MTVTEVIQLIHSSHTSGLQEASSLFQSIDKQIVPVSSDIATAWEEYEIEQLRRKSLEKMMKNTDPDSEFWSDYLIRWKESIAKEAMFRWLINLIKMWRRCPGLWQRWREPETTDEEPHIESVADSNPSIAPLTWIIEE